MRSWIHYCLAVCIVNSVLSSSLAADPGKTFKLIYDPHIRMEIQGAIRASRVSIEVEVFKLTDRGVIHDLVQAARRNVRVRIILCPSQKKNRQAAARLQKAGANVRWYPLTRKNQIMHLKLGCFDKEKLVFGSPNWTYWGLTLHHEGILVITREILIQEVLKQFEADWTKSSRD
jgi:phosphatidylserine/phosphatidylglycerophosphate/cardiolipin synthase-like enzyme